MTQKTALIIGGGSGIGADAARHLAASGYRVGIMSSSGKGEALGKELGGIGFTGSNLNPDDLSAFIDLAMTEFGRIDGLVNGAGHGPKGDLMEISDDDWHLGMDYYLLNVIRAVRLVQPIMEKQGSGSIVNVPFRFQKPFSTVGRAFPMRAATRVGDHKCASPRT